MKHSFFRAVVVSILLYGCTTWMLTNWIEKKLDSNYSRMLWAILNKSWRQPPTKQLYGHLPPITKTIKVRRTRHAGHCWRSRDELINDVLLWTLAHGWVKAGWPARTYIQQLCEVMGYSPEDLPEAMNDREEKRERVRDIHAGGMTRWGWDDVILDCLSSTKSLILSIWFFMYSVCNSFCAFLRFRALILVGFFLLHSETVFMSVRFSLTANVSHGPLGLVLCLVCMHSIAASKWTLTKFSYLSFGVCVSVFCSVLNLFLSANIYLSLISLLISRAQSVYSGCCS